jgi:hypothetical protein
MKTFPFNTNKICFCFRCYDFQFDRSLPPVIQIKEFKIFYPSDTDNNGIVLEVTGTKPPGDILYTYIHIYTHTHTRTYSLCIVCCI